MSIENFNRCAGCTGECLGWFQKTVEVEEAISDLSAKEAPKLGVSVEDTLDGNQGAIDIGRERLYRALEEMGCSLSTEEIDSNVMTLRGY